jgi:hypothetical protein
MDAMGTSRVLVLTTTLSGVQSAPPPHVLMVVYRIFGDSDRLLRYCHMCVYIEEFVTESRSTSTSSLLDSVSGIHLHECRYVHTYDFP